MPHFPYPFESHYCLFFEPSAFSSTSFDDMVPILVLLFSYTQCMLVCSSIQSVHSHNYVIPYPVNLIRDHNVLLFTHHCTCLNIL